MLLIYISQVLPHQSHHQILSCNMMTIQMGLISKGSKDLPISGGFFFHLHAFSWDGLFKNQDPPCAAATYRAELRYNSTLAWKTVGHISRERRIYCQWKMWSSFPNKKKRLNQTKSELNNVNLFPLLVEGRYWELKCTTTTHKTAAFTLAHVYQYTSYWIHNYIIRYNCICYGLVWQPNEAVIKELAVPLMRA